MDIRPVPLDSDQPKCGIASTGWCCSSTRLTRLRHG